MALGEHAAIWTQTLVWWPSPRSAPPVRDVQSLSAYQLAAAGLDRREIGDVLGLAADTLRHRADRTTRRDRPSVERGEELAVLGAHEDQGRALRRLIGTLEDDDPPLPRVYHLGDDEPPFTHFNPHIRLLDGAWRQRSDAEGFRQRAEAALVRARRP